MSPAITIFAASRLGIWIAAALAFAWFPKTGSGLGSALWVRGDSGWFLTIAHHGYWSDPQHTPAFFPLYPTLVAGLGWLIRDYPLAGLLISLACCAIAFELMWRLAAERIGPSVATRGVLYLALFPMAVFLGAVYSESLFFVLAVAAFFFAERDHWASASIAAGGAMLTRSVGVAVLVGLVLLAWPSVRHLAWLVVAPAMFLAFPIALHFQAHHWDAFSRAEKNWDKHLSSAGPIGGLWQGIEALWAHTDNFSERYFLAVNIEDLVYLIPFLVLLPLVWRTLGAAYAVYAGLVLAIPLSFPAAGPAGIPLFSMPRYTIAAFPCFIALAVVGKRPNAHTAIVAVSSTLLGVAIVQWTLGTLA